MKQMEQEDKRREVVERYRRGGVSMRELGRIYRVSGATICRWVKEEEGEGWNKEPERRKREEGRGEGGRKERSGVAVVSAEVRQLRKELEEARLYNELLNAMIDIAEDQFEIPIRKKSGAKR